MCTMREFEDRVHKGFASGQMFSLVHFHASRHCGNGHSIEEGTES
jgi:hypothetical protein